MGDKFLGYSLVQDGKPSDVNDEHPFPINKAQRSWSHYRRTRIGVLVLLLSVALNVVDYVQLCQQKAIAAEACRSKFGEIR